MKQVVVFPRGQLTELDKARLSEADIIAVEADDPKQVVTMLPTVPTSLPIDADDFTMAAMHALANSMDHVGMGFVKELHRRMLVREKNRASRSATEASKP